MHRCAGKGGLKGGKVLLSLPCRFSSFTGFRIELGSLRLAAVILISRRKSRAPQTVKSAFGLEDMRVAVGQVVSVLGDMLRIDISQAEDGFIQIIQAIPDVPFLGFVSQRTAGKELVFRLPFLVATGIGSLPSAESVARETAAGGKSACMLIVQIETFIVNAVARCRTVFMPGTFFLHPHTDSQRMPV
ncbi:hypothetical protein Barb4_00132 [Bacteroidales bacterium Barb4]|nr:hypothetical protein Barb4_00132 [Bacteroidales bacterium Barb4]